MAEEVPLKGKFAVDNSQAMQSIQEVDDAMQNVGSSGEEAGASISEKFNAVNNIVGGLLPRQFQSLVRRFQSTQRAVRRAGKSFAFLRASISALGIPLLITAVQLLIDNWQAFTDLLGFTSEEARTTAEETKNLKAAMDELRDATEGYLDILASENAALSAKREAYKELQRQSPLLKGMTMEEAEATYQLVFAMDELARKTKLRAEQENLDKRIEKLREQIKEEKSWWQAKSYKDLKDKVAEMEINRLMEQRTGLQEELLDISATETEYLERQARLAKEAADAAKAEADAEREREAARAQREREREQREQKEADVVARREKQAEQLGMTEEELMMDELDRQERAELALVKSEEAKVAIKEFYAQKWKDWYDAFQEREQDNLDAQADADEQKEAQEAERILQGRQKLQEAIDKMEMDRFLQETDERTAELMENELYFEKLLDQADEFGYDRTALEEERRMRQEEINKRYNDKEVADEEAKQAAIMAAKQKAASEFAGLIGEMGNLAEEGSAAAKGLAIVEVLTNQAIAMAQTVANAQKAASAGGPAAPLLAVAYTAAGIANVIGTFASIKKILDQAKAAGSGSTGGIGSGRQGSRSTQVAPMVPNQNYDVENNATQNMNVSAYVVQSQLQGEQLQYNQALNRSTL
jgi:hypothetical protein